MISEIRVREFKKIPVIVYEEIKEMYPLGTGYAIIDDSQYTNWIKDKDIEWVDNNGINTPYLISWI
jgi:hypothetical protein